MRHALAPAALVLLALQAAAFAQGGPDIRYVTAAQTEARSGRSSDPRFYATNRLQRGAKVEVIQEFPDGWLMIVPPEGSFSYINTRFLQHMSAKEPNYVVALDNHPVEVFIGSELVRERPTIIGVRLKRGAQVISRGRPISEGGETFMPIDPPPGEGRFIRAEAVSKTPPAVNGIASAGGGVAGVIGAHSSFTPSGAIAPSNAPSANRPVSPDELWQQAMNAQRAGQTSQAICLFNQVSVQAAYTNPQMAATARQWVDYLQYGHQAYGAGAGAVPVNPVSTGGALVGRTYALGSDVARADAAGAVRLNPPAAARTGWNDPTAARTSGAAPSSAGPQQLPPGWVAFRGRLREAGRAIEGVKTYVVEMEEKGYVRPVAYARSGAGIDLGSQVGRVIEVWGPAVYRGDIRTNYMTVMRLIP
jgi:hypothetical protein